MCLRKDENVAKINLRAQKYIVLKETLKYEQQIWDSVLHK